MVIYDESIFIYWNRFTEGYEEMFLKELPELNELSADLFIEAPRVDKFPIPFCENESLTPFLVGVSSSNRLFIWGHNEKITSPYSHFWHVESVSTSAPEHSRLDKWSVRENLSGFTQLFDFGLGGCRPDCFDLTRENTLASLKACKSLFSPHLLDTIKTLNVIREL